MWEAVVGFLVNILLPWAIALIQKYLSDHFNDSVSAEGWTKISGFFQSIYDEAVEKDREKVKVVIEEFFAKILPITIVLEPVVITPVSSFLKDVADTAVASHKDGSLKLPAFRDFPEWVDEPEDWRDDGGG